MRLHATRPIRAAAALLPPLLLGSLAACSTARYAEPIKSFSEAAGQATEAVKAMNGALAEATLDYAVKVSTDPALGSLELKDDADCGAYIPEDTPEDAVRCRAVFVIKGVGVDPVTITREQYSNPMGNMVAVMVAVQNYATNLAAVQSDNSAASVNASIDKVRANLAELMKASGQSSAAPGNLPAAAASGVKWAFGQYMESVKLDALRNATQAAADPLAKAAVAYKGFAESAKLLLSQTVMSEAARAVRLRPDNSEATTRNAIRQANAYDDLLTAPLSPMLDNLVAAHQRLAEALDGGGDLSLSDAFARFGEIKDQAEQIAKIAKDLSAALKPADS